MRQLRAAFRAQAKRLAWHWCFMARCEVSHPRVSPAPPATSTHAVHPCGRRACAAARQVGAARQTEPARRHLGGRRRRRGGRAGERDLAGHGRRRRARVPLGHAARGAARRGRARARRQARARGRCRVSSARWRAHAAHVNARQPLRDSMGWSPCSATSSYIGLTAGPADVSSQPKAAWGQGFDRARSPCAAARPPRRCGFPSQPVPGRAARWRPWRSARWATA